MEPWLISLNVLLSLTAVFAPTLPPNHKLKIYPKTWAKSFLNPTTPADSLQPLRSTKWRPGGAELGGTRFFIVSWFMGAQGLYGSIDTCQIETSLKGDAKGISHWIRNIPAERDITTHIVGFELLVPRAA